MQIAPGIDAVRWQALQLDDPESTDWIEAVSILRARINERFIDPIDQLIATEAAKPISERRFGFAVLAIDCLLVETLEAFIEGLEDTRSRSGEMFKNYLTRRQGFASFFDEALAKKFFKHFRCGILHQAEIAGDGKVWTVGPLINVNGDAVTVNRNLFHETLKNEFNSYLSELLDARNKTLRENFRKKMNFISRM